MELINQLVKKKKLLKQQATELRMEIKESGKSPEEVILEKKILSEDELFQLKSKIIKVPLKKIVVEQIPQQVLNILPLEAMEYYKMAPFALDQKEGILKVGMIYPENAQAKEALKFLVRQQKLKAKIFLITFSDFKKIQAKSRAPKKEVERALEKLEQEMKEEKTILGEKERFERLVEEAPVIKMVAVILRQAVEGKASDIHIEPTRENLRVRYRLDGILYPSLLLPLKVLPAIVSRIKILSNLKIEETRIPQDGRFSAKIGEKIIDFRVSTFPTTLGEKVAIRILDPEEALKSLEQLGLNENNFQIVKKSAQSSYGMILVTGPTGSGKTTTLYALLRLLNKQGVNIVTLEDPVEYFMDGINQSQIRPEIGYDFAKGLRQILRQDPDIIMVGEIRDRETAELAVHAALTGHLVLSTLHTTGTIGVIPRLIDMGIESFLLPSTLSLIISQRLVRLLCPFCKKKVIVEKKVKNYLLEKIKTIPQFLKKELKIKKRIFVFEPKGCKKCNFKGYSGRIGVFETLKMTDDLAEIIVKNHNEREIFKQARKQGMITMEEDGILKVLEGVTSLEEVMRAIKEK